MSPAALLAISLGLGAIGAVGAWGLRPRGARLLAALLGALAAGLLLAASAAVLATGAPADLGLWRLASFGRLHLTLDALSAVFGAITGLVYLAASILAAVAIGRQTSVARARSLTSLYFALYLAVVLVLTAGDALTLLLAWEAMSIASYLLVTLGERRNRDERAAFRLLGLGEVGTLAAALGLLLAAAPAGGFAFGALRAASPQLGEMVRWGIFLLTVAGFGVKAGLVPMNFWLPPAYAAAPDGIAPVFAGATLNLGLYGILRVNADLVPATGVGPGLVLLAAGATTALVGILYANTANDLRALLAHSSIENAGIIIAGFGAGLVFVAAGAPALAAIAFAAGLYHALNHSLYKTLLMGGCDAVEARVGHRDLDRLGGLIRGMPWTAALFLVGALSIAAMPPTNGFVSEWLTLQALLQSAALSSHGVRIIFALAGAALALAAALAVTCFVRAFAMGFLGWGRSPEATQAREASRARLAPLAALALACLLLGVVPTYVLPVLDRAVVPLAHAASADAVVPDFFQPGAGAHPLPPSFVRDFHDLGAQVGRGVVPGRGLVLLRRGGASNPVVFALSTSYMVVVLAILLLATALLTRLGARRLDRVRRGVWDGGIRRLLPDMTYTATGFANPVRVIFQAVFRPTTEVDTRAHGASNHFRASITRSRTEVHLAERIVGEPVARALAAASRALARMHNGRLNAYVVYGLLALLVVLIAAGFG